MQAGEITDVSLAGVTMPVQLLRRSFTVDEFHRMGEARVFGEDDRIEVYRKPSSDRYLDVRTLGRDQTLAPEAFPTARLPVADILG